MDYILEPINFLLSNKTYTLGFLTSLGLVLVFTPIVARFAKMYKVLDKPDPRKLHKNPTPLMGGLAIYAALWLPIFALYFWINNVTLTISDRWWEILMVAMSGAVVMLSGIIDDKRGLNATKKLLVQVPVAFIFSLYIAKFSNLNFPGFGEINLGIWGVPITMLWIIGITNALNLIDGIDGLACGVTLIVAMTNAVIALTSGNTFMTIVMLGMSGACLGFLYYNYPPAKIFLGDTGSLMLGMTLATTSVLTNSKSNIAGSFLIAVIALGYPVTDTLLAMVRRRILGKPMFSADYEHIHHRLLAMGINRRKAALIIYGFCLVLSVLALVMVLGDKFASLMALIIFGLSIALALYLLGFFKIISSEELQISRVHYKISHHLMELLEAKLSLAENIQQIFGLLEQAGSEFGFLSIEAWIDPGLVNSSEKAEYSWTNNDKRELIAPQNMKVEKFAALEGGLLVQARYLEDEIIAGLRREHLVKIRHLIDHAAERIEQIYPPKKETAKAAGVMGGVKSVPVMGFVQTVKPHDHICLVYDTEDEWRQAIIPFIADGLRKKEKCVYAADTHNEDQVRALLREEKIDVGAAEASRQLVILKARQAYARDGFFDPDKMIAVLVSETQKAVKEGYSSVRSTGEMSWASNGCPGPDRLLEYEQKLNSQFLKDCPCVYICQYDRKKIDANVIREVINCHSLVLANGYLYKQKENIIKDI